MEKLWCGGANSLAKRRCILAPEGGDQLAPGYASLGAVVFMRCAHLDLHAKLMQLRRFIYARPGLPHRPGQCLNLGCHSANE